MMAHVAPALSSAMRRPRSETKSSRAALRWATALFLHVCAVCLHGVVLLPPLSARVVCLARHSRLSILRLYMYMQLTVC